MSQIEYVEKILVTNVFGLNKRDFSQNPINTMAPEYYFHSRMKQSEQLPYNTPPHLYKPPVLDRFSETTLRNNYLPEPINQSASFDRLSIGSKSKTAYTNDPIRNSEFTKKFTSVVSGNYSYTGSC